MKAGQVGWIGLGVMGSALAKRLIDAHYDLVVYNRTREKALKLIPEEKILSSPCAVAQVCDVVFLSLTGLNAAEEILFSEKTGIVFSGNRRLTLIDTSTIGPEKAISLHQRLQTFGIEYVECPISGGPEGARAGKLTAVLSGSDEERVTKYKGIVENFAAKIHFVGGPGKAQMMKVLNNQAESINMLAAAEVISIGLKAGIDLAVMREVLSDLRGYSQYMDVLFDRLIHPKEETSVSLEVRVKDIGLANVIAGQHGVPAPVTALTEKLYTLAMERYGAKADQTRCIELMKEKLGFC